MRKAFLASVILLAASLTGCAAVVEKGATVAKACVQTSKGCYDTVLADVRAAKSITSPETDAIAYGCYAHVEKWLVEHPPLVGPEGDGAGDGGGVYLFQRVRNVRRGLTDGGLTDEFRIACGALAFDSQQEIQNLLLKIGLVVPLP
jgi:hypothetical protein